ncbi:MAG TPA: APC family permease [Gemmatimonadales bacterium]|nr:APC family permease [Gemmatimonadales bacterium]
MYGDAVTGLKRSLTLVEYFTFGFGTMIGVGWLVLMPDWLGRGGPGGAMLAFALGGVLLLPIALTYGRLVREIPDAGAEIAYAERVFPRFVAFAAGWIMVLAYAIVCPWEAVVIGNLLARVIPAMDTMPLYEVAGRTIYAPRLAAGLILSAIITAVNYRGIRQSGLFQDVTTFGLLAAFAVFAMLGLVRGDPSRMEPLFARPGAMGALVSTVLVMQIVPYFMTGFESVAKGSEEARPGFEPGHFARAINLSVASGALFYVLVVAAVAFVYPWREIVDGNIGTEAAFQRAFGSRTLTNVILIGAFLSLFKVLNGNFVAASRLVFSIGRRGLVHASLGRIHPTYGTPAVAVLLMGVLTVAGSLLGDALLIPVAEVGSLASGVGWLSACVAYLMLERPRGSRTGTVIAGVGAMAALGIIVMKVVPGVPGSFRAPEWMALGAWCALGLAFWLARPRVIR